MAFLAYNGKFLMRMGKWIGLESQGPVPEPIPSGAIRWKFYDDDLQNWDSTCQDRLNYMTNNWGYWSPVYDSVTGAMIPGMYDWIGDTGNRDFRYVFGAGGGSPGLNSLTYPCDLVDANLSSIGGNYWTSAFSDVTKLATATIKTSMGTPSAGTSSNCNRMFAECNSVTNINLHLPSWLGDADFNDPIICGRLTSLTLVSDAVSMPIALSHWIFAHSLQELTLICTNANCTYIIQDGKLLGDDLDTRVSIRKVTLAAPAPTAYIGGGASNQIFRNCVNLQSVKQYATYGSDDTSSWVEVPLKLSGYADYAFSGCSCPVNLDLSGVSKFSHGFDSYTGFGGSHDDIISMYKQLLRKFPVSNNRVADDNAAWFRSVPMSSYTSACILTIDGGTLDYSNIASGSGLRFKFLDTTYVPSTSSTGNATSNNGTWTVVDQANGIWDWTGTTGAEGTSSSAFSFCQVSWFLTTYTGTLRQGVNDCVLIACGANYSPARTSHAFQNCTGLLDIIHPINLSALADEAFNGCTNLTDMPIIKNSNVQDCTRTFYGDVAVQAHVKDTYDKLSATAMTYNGCFTNCGPAEERAQIPTSWGGTMA